MAVSKQFNNRRQPVLINAIDPEILTEEKLSADGYVKNTDYATGTTGGVVKVANSSGLSITSQGTLQAAVRTAQQYDDGAGTLVIGKGTLENIKLKLSEDFFKTVVQGVGSYPAGTTFTGFKVTILESGDLDFTFTDVTEP